MQDTVLGMLAGGAALGVLATMWTKIKGFAWRLVGMFVQRVEVPTEAGHDAVVAYLIANFQRSRNYDKMYGASWEYQRDGRYGLVPYEVFGNRLLILWNGWFPFLFTNQVESKAASSKGTTEGSAAGMKVYSTVTFLRGTLDMEDVLRNACAARNNVSWAVEDEQTATKNRFCIHHVPARGDGNSDSTSSSDGLAWYQQGNYRLLSHSPDQLGKARTNNGKALDNLIFPQRVKALISEVELWRKSKDWYAEKGIAWKRGWLLYGPPGTGKTAVARAFAEDLNMPIYVYNLAEMGNHELMKTWTEMQTNTPCIALIEDIDNVFHGRENVARRHSLFPMMVPEKRDGDGGDRDKPGRGPLAPLTFDCLLNCLDGVERADGIFTIITTNDLTKIDPALGLPRTLPDGATEFISTRPGRIDKAVELTYMEAADKKRMAARILGAYEPEHLEMVAFVEKFPDLQETPAQFQERCAQVALKCFWRDSAAPKEWPELGDGIFSNLARRVLVGRN
ncbi:AAA family ATPase [Gemmata sp.]|uniref:AAA family ATPase n=1 Tax=Gemmata sp. TaxID=1914242 RepID=UPI003F704FC6